MEPGHGIPAGRRPFRSRLLIVSSLQTSLSPGCRVCSGKEIEHFCSAFDRVLNRPERTWQILRCRRCGFGWTDPQLSPEEIASHYPAAYLGDTRKTLNDFLSGQLSRSRSWRGEREKIRLVESYVPRGKILDVGCGDAKFLWALDPRSWERSGVDFSRATVDLVRSHIAALHLVAGDIFSGEFSPGSFNVITFWHSLEHLPSPEKVLERAAALLRPGGWIFVSLPNLDSLQARRFRQRWYGFDDVPRHLFHFSTRSLDRLLVESGFEIRRHLPFSRLVNYHTLKHSLLHRCEACRGGRVLYYALKPFALALFPLLERLSGEYGILTTVARKP